MTRHRIDWRHLLDRVTWGAVGAVWGWVGGMVLTYYLLWPHLCSGLFPGGP